MTSSMAGPRAPGAPHPGVRVPAVLALLAALLALAVPAGFAFADGGSVSLGVHVGAEAQGPALGGTGSVALGVEMGIRQEGAPDAAGPSGGTVSIGASVGYAEASRQHAVSFDAGRGAFPGDGSSVERAVPEGGRAKAPADPERPGWRFVGWFLAGAPDPSWDAGGESAVPLGEAWDPSRPVTDGVSLHARWARLSGAGSVPLGVEVAQRVEPPGAGDGGSVALGAEVALRREAPSAPEGTVPIGAEVAFREAAREVKVTFDAGRGAFSGGSSLRESAAEANAPVARPEDPKRAGWLFAGWHLPGAPDASWDAEGESAAPLGPAWDFSRGVAGDVALHARWELRLDVTVPVSVAFAVDASTGEAKGPDPGRYAIKSRTVRDVEVDSLALECRQAELEAFFEAPAAGWQAALAATTLSLEGERAPEIALPFADASSAGPAWQVSRPLSDAERAGWRVPAFAYGSTPPDGAWQGSDPSRRLPLDVGLTIGDGLEVRTGQAEAVPIAHLKVTVSARP